MATAVFGRVAKALTNPDQKGYYGIEGQERSIWTRQIKEVVEMRLPMQFPEHKATAEPLWSVIDEFFRAPFAWPGALPAVDVEETDDAYIVTAEAPGFSKGDIEVEVRNETLVIRGKKEVKEGRRFLRRERASSYERFERALQLPGPIDHRGVSATFTKGELVITLPKDARTDSLKIPVT